MHVVTGLLLLVVAAGYARGLHVLGTGRFLLGVQRHGRVRVGAFAGGLVALAVAALPPLDTVADERFSAHMVQHMVLVAVAAPLLAAGAVGLPLLLSLPRRARRRVVLVQHRLQRTPGLSVLLLPVVACGVHVVALWVWHMPAAYDAALRHEPVHVAEHASFLASAALLWWHVVGAGRRRLRGPVAALYFFGTLLPTSALGAVLTLARTPLYPAEVLRGARAGVDPLADQQLAGLVMWIPADVVYLAAVVTVMFAWLSTSTADHDTGRGARTAVVLGTEEVA